MTEHPEVFRGLRESLTRAPLDVITQESTARFALPLYALTPVCALSITGPIYIGALPYTGPLERSVS
jgi:hypothetical protein